jgi:hypothetical protein
MNISIKKRCFHLNIQNVFESSGMVNYCLALPFLPGGTELAKKFTEENGTTKEHDEFFKIARITQERIWIQRSAPGSGAPDLEIVNIETDDLDKMLKEYATSSHPWAIKFRKFVSKAFGIDLSSGPPQPLNELIVDWRESSQAH